MTVTVTARPGAVGIERIGVYPTSLALSADALCAARGANHDYVRDAYLMDERAVNAPWEDPVTMAVNAAHPMLTAEDRASIGLLIVGSESAVDQEKPLSTWVHRFLELPSRCRNFEVKHACYGATAGLQMAVAWLAAGLSEGQKALVINTDHAMCSIGEPWEFVMGAGAAAVLLSDKPDLLAVEVGRSGIFAQEISDVMRPTLLVETGNSEASLHSYFDGLHGAWADYQARYQAEFVTEFQRNIYHVPLGGMAWRAHKSLLLANTDMNLVQARADFDARVLPSLRYNRRMGGTYGASTFIALLGLVDSCSDTSSGTRPELLAGDRVGVFAFGAGSCAELWTGKVGARAREVAAGARVAEQLDARLQLTVEEYEYAERARESGIGVKDWTPATHGLRDWYQRSYRDRGRLVLTGIRDWVREYAWS